MGWFTQPDPIGLAGGLNLYGYAGGDPVNSADPFGLCGPLTNLCARAVVFLMGRAAPLVGRLGAAMTGLSAGPQAATSNSRAAATLGRLGATLEGNLDKFDDLHLEAAAAEQAGFAVAFKASGEAYDHLTEVRNAMRGMRNVIAGVNRLLRNGRPTEDQRAVAEALRQSALEALKKAEQAGVSP